MQKETQPTRRIAVTGATGLIGSRLMSALRKTRLPTRALVRSAGRIDHAEETVGTMLDRSVLDALVRDSDAVIHLAGVAHTSLRDAAEEEQARMVNVEGTRSLIQAASKAGVRHFLLMSSAHVYRGQSGLDLHEDAVTEGDTVYGRMKLEAEQIALSARSENMRITILRPCLTYGPGVRFNLQSLLRAVHKRYYVHVRRQPVLRSLASVDTVSAAILHLLDTDTPHAVFNVADEAPVDLEQWVNYLADLMRVKHPHTVPKTAMEIAAGFGSLLRKAGLPAAITRDSLGKLTSSFSISTERLASTGFSWPETRETVLREMISAEFRATLLQRSR